MTVDRLHRELPLPEVTDLRLCCALSKNIVTSRIGGEMKARAREAAAIRSPVGANHLVGSGQSAVPSVSRALRERRPGPAPVLDEASLQLKRRGGRTRRSRHRAVPAARCP